MEKYQTKRAARNIKDEQPDRLRYEVLTELSGVLLFEAYVPEPPPEQPAPET